MRIDVIGKYLLLCAGFSLLCLGGQAYGEEGGKVVKKDIYLTPEALCGEDMPFFKHDYIPPAKYTETTISENSVYLSFEALCGEDPSRSYKLIIPSKYIRVKHTPQDMELDLEKMISEDPSFVKGQEKY